MDIDRLFTMTDKELTDYLEVESEKVIQSARPELRDRLRAIHNGARLQVEVSKTPQEAMVRTNRLMWVKFAELNEELKQFK